jgi:hypothetical protein
VCRAYYMSRIDETLARLGVARAELVKLAAIILSLSASLLFLHALAVHKEAFIAFLQLHFGRINGIKINDLYELLSVISIWIFAIAVFFYSRAVLQKPVKSDKTMNLLAMCAELRIDPREYALHRYRSSLHLMSSPNDQFFVEKLDSFRGEIEIVTDILRATTAQSRASDDARIPSPHVTRPASNNSNQSANSARPSRRSASGQSVGR